MSAPLIRCDHDEIGQISKVFSKQGEDIKAVHDKLKSAHEQLEGGKDWVGKGADAFFQEMNDMVHPAMQRLAEALGEASQITNQIGQTMQEGDDEAQSVILEVNITISL